MKNLLTATALMIAATAAHAAPGYMTTSIDVAHREIPVPLHIWYPSQQDTKITAQAQSGLFRGADVYPDATPAQGAFPVVIYSHGSGGNAVNGAWIAAHLADQGMIVIAPNHPGTTSRDSDPHQTIKIWERPADLRAALDWVQGNPNGITPDMDHVAAMGFSLGGHSALALAGARVQKQAYIDYCDDYAGMHDCGWMTAGGVDFNDIDAPRYEADMSDARITTVVAIDPALPHAMTESSLEAIDMPSLLINLGSVQTTPPAINAKGIAAAIPGAQIHYVAQAEHFSFLAECRPMGKLIIGLFADEPICTDHGNRSRADMHEELKSQIGAFLRSSFAQTLPHPS